MDDKTSPSSIPPRHQELSYTTIPLNTPATEIRLLELFPSADFFSPLSCRLYTTPIASPAPFKALSYAWGSDDKTHLIYIDSSNVTSDNGNGNDAESDASLASGLSAVTSSDDNEVNTTVDGGRTGADALNGEKCMIRITSSLDTCLRHLRAIHHRHHHPSTILTLWIDQLCIDQSDSDEKAVQVGLMGQIYSQAKQVLIWLGPAADGSDEVMDMLAELGREYESVGKSVADAPYIAQLMTEIGRGVEFEDRGGEKRKGGIGANEENIVNVPGGGGGDAAAAGNSGESGSRVDLGVDVTDIEALDKAAVACTRNEAEASTGKTAMAVVEEGAARLFRLGLSGELQAFFRRPWFTRLWVVQEACHCADTVFVCGMKPPVSYDILGPMSICGLIITQQSMLKSRYMLKSGVRDPSFDGDLERFIVSVMSDLLVQTVPLYKTRYQTVRQISKGNGGDNLFSLLVATYTQDTLTREAKLHRDRIYALLGLAADVNELGIQPDYSSQTRTAQILTGVAEAIIGKTKDGFPVEVLSYSQFPKTTLDDGSDEQLPSWVPDWGSGLSNPFYYRLRKTHMFMACGPHRSVDMVPTTTAGVLGLRGYLVDTIEEVVGMMPTRNRWRESIEYFEKLGRLWELSKQKNQPIYDTQARREEALWRVPVEDTVAGRFTSELVDQLDATRAKAGFALEYHKWRRGLELYEAMDCDTTTVPGLGRGADGVDDDKKKKALEWLAHASGADTGLYYYLAMSKATTGRRLYLTKEGYMGTGPSNMQPGDVVVVFPGARIPFVLRPTGEDNTFAYVGDVYCDGIMDGEITLREERRDFFLV
ncbi:hypothetical protein GE21DRAFT_9735 [Neurospora crassa]|uniref:Heterokaryon incompatibility protein n=1 Tax=Neurospora crassa (strain ATCC 24698 / 74-OR23-1A / CBS 708.71 / DSM 1257 / FGSC 987) TaxID=367110 RepID=Q7S2T0_NEUCR|nr:heterokaryon incompatibility protein [Neurospora crassa OR74A]EAA29756.3 heterokaryon incompatibility protein [Neurospora crassa OR74A]KHE86171.1 hypothetical protein GE21DRAFT_9735 [Neurospora crassa]|eukprot:XP_958992.3 heterokaryon incompatibility protein [Neurospora crassa OR74A]